MANDGVSLGVAENGGSIRVMMSLSLSLVVISLWSVGRGRQLLKTTCGHEELVNTNDFSTCPLSLGMDLTTSTKGWKGRVFIAALG